MVLEGLLVFIVFFFHSTIDGWTGLFSFTLIPSCFIWKLFVTNDVVGDTVDTAIQENTLPFVFIEFLGFATMVAVGVPLVSCSLVFCLETLCNFNEAAGGTGGIARYLSRRSH